jgi:asparagine synthase (glutamine-hydrolysing)
VVPASILIGEKAASFMCGIAGIFKFRESSFEITEPLLVRMRDTMAHRGPDGAGVWISPDRRVGLAHRRLSIIDLSEAGAQPMPAPDGNLWITYNGEIYNHMQLRAELEKEGYRYRSRTDTESILYAYDRWGLDCAHHLDGMFAFGLWDAKKRRLCLFRDRIGVKPLYYTFVEGQILFASEIKALLAHPAVPRDVEPAAMYHFLTLYAAPAPLTMFKGIFKLPAGHRLIVEEGKVPHVERYWDAVVPRQRFLEDFRNSGEKQVEDFCILSIRQMLETAIEKRMMSDVPFGVFLSGGIDSSTNVALMAKHMNRPVDTFTVAFKGHPRHDETEHARLVARTFGANHHEVFIGEQDLRDYLPQLIHHQDEPIADPVCVPLYYVSKLARDNGTIVVQVGEGSDEQFCGYRWSLFFDRLYHGGWRKFSLLPFPMRRAAAWAAKGAASWWPSWKTSFAAELAERSAGGQELFWGGAIAYLETVKQRYAPRKRFSSNGSIPMFEGLYDSGGGMALHTSAVVRDLLAPMRAGKPEADFTERMIYLELKHRLPELLLMRVDKITMSTSVEARVPFLDYRLVEFSMNIPAELKMKGDVTKHILKKAVEGLIPGGIIHRPKQGFGAPVQEWMDSHLGRDIRDAFRSTGLRKRGWLDFQRIERDASSARWKGQPWWVMYNLVKWYDHWIEGKS